MVRSPLCHSEESHFRAGAAPPVDFCMTTLTPRIPRLAAVLIANSPVWTEATKVKHPTRGRVGEGATAPAMANNCTCSERHSDHVHSGPCIPRDGLIALISNTKGSSSITSMVVHRLSSQPARNRMRSLFQGEVKGIPSVETA
jgi:hypothetical protein